MSAYMAWLNDNREKIKEEKPGVSVTEVSKIAGQMWKKVEDDEKQVCRGEIWLNFPRPAIYFAPNMG